MTRGDDEFRLLVDRALSRFYASGQLRDVYVKWFGQPGPDAIPFYRRVALPD